MTAILRPNPERVSSFAQIRRRTAQFLTTIAMAHMLSAALLNAVTFPEAVVIALWGAVILGAAYVTCLLLAQFQQVSAAASLLVFILFLELYVGGGSVISSAILVTVTVATLISSQLLFYAYNLTNVVLILLVSLRGGSIFAAAPLDLTTLEPAAFIGEVVLLVALLGIAVTVRYFRRTIEISIANAEETTVLLQIGSEVGQVTAGVTTLDELLPRTVTFIQERFGHYHAQVFMLNDTRDVAVLRASTGEVGRVLLERDHRLNVGSDSVIGRVTQTGEIVNYDDTSTRGVHYRNELLPETRAELALPIRDGDRIIGALDVQSTVPRAFDSNQVQALQTMTTLLAAAIRNVSLFEAQQKNLQENQRLYIEMQSSLSEIQRLNRQLTRESWEQFTREIGDASALTIEGNVSSQDVSWAHLLEQAEQSRQPVVSDEGRYAVAAPIMLRGHVIGSLEVEPGDTLDEDDVLEIVRAVTGRLAVSLDNARLFEGSQEARLFEQRINDIVGQYQDANTVDELLQITLTELSESLGAERGAIRLSKAATDADETTVNEPNGVSPT